MSRTTVRFGAITTALVLGLGTTTASATPPKPSKVYFACEKSKVISLLTAKPHVCPTGSTRVTGLLKGANFQNAQLRRVRLQDDNLEGTNFAYADVSRANLKATVSKRADFSHAYLAGTSLYRSSLKFGRFKRANLTGADLTHSNLEGAIFVEAQLWGANLTEVTAADTSFVNADFTGTTLTGADLTFATLSGVRSGGVVGKPSLPPDWIVKAGYLLGPKANLSGANLRGLSLNGVDLAQANLKGANLRHAKFIGANLSGATFAGAALKGVSYDPSTVCPNGKQLNSGGDCPK